MGVGFFGANFSRRIGMWIRGRGDAPAHRVGIPPYPRELFSRHIFITHCNERITSAKRKLIRHQREEIQCDPYLFYLAEFLASGTKWRRNNFFALSSSQKVLSASSLWR